MIYDDIYDIILSQSISMMFMNDCIIYMMIYMMIYMILYLVSQLV